MSDAIFLPDFTENIETEAKLALGRDGRGTLPVSFWETYSAFANTNGGTVFLGVEEKNNEFIAVGIPDVAKVEDELWNLMNNRQKVSLNVLGTGDVERLPLENGNNVLIIHVPRAERKQRPVFIGKTAYDGTYKRNRSGDYRCDKEEVEKILAEKVHDARDSIFLRGFGIEDLSLETLTAYRQRLANLKPDHPYNDLEVTDFLLKIKTMVKNRETGEIALSLAGLLMFGRSDVIADVCPHYFLDYRELPVNGSKTEWNDRLTADGSWSGNLYDFYRQAITRLTRDLKVPLSFQQDQRDDDTPLHKALREALVNSLVHADYGERASILIVKAPDYFGFRNPGHMRISIEDALEGGKSDCRNRFLQLMFSLIGLGEQAGSGIPRILKRWGELAYRQPELWESDGPNATLMRMRMTSLLPPETVELLRTELGEDFDRLTKNEQLAMVTSQIEGFVTNQRLQQVTRLHSTEITGLLKGLVQTGLLNPSGVGRATTYSLTGQENIDLAEPYSKARITVKTPQSVTTSGESVTTSEENVTTSGESVTTSDKSVTTSEGTAPELKAASILNQENWADLWANTVDYRDISGNMPVAKRKEIIIKLCQDTFLTKEELAQLFGMDARGLRNRFLTPMYNDGILEYRFPNEPNHQHQSYRTSKQNT